MSASAELPLAAVRTMLCATAIKIPMMQTKPLLVYPKTEETWAAHAGQPEFVGTYQPCAPYKLTTCAASCETLDRGCSALLFPVNVAGGQLEICTMTTGKNEDPFEAEPFFPATEDEAIEAYLLGAQLLRELAKDIDSGLLVDPTEE
jgi:hypothetical protein